MLIYTGYMDESGTHGDSPVTVMGGVMATARQWADFETEFDKVKKRHQFRTFHTKKFKARQGDFKGWSDDQVFALLQNMAWLTNGAFTEGVSMTLDNASYVADYRGGEKPKKLQLDSRYGLCFRQCLLLFVLEAEKRRLRGRWPKLHIVVESGHQNVGSAITIFNEMKRELESYGCDLLHTVTVADKDKCDPLMMADFIAHVTYATERKGHTAEFRQRAGRPTRGQSAVTHLTFKPGGLANIKDMLIKKIQQKRG